MKNLKYILIIIVVIVVLVMIFSFTSIESKEDATKKNEINNLFAIWMNVAGTGDQRTLTQNELAIKKDLFEKLNSQEIISLKSYSLALQDVLKNKNNPVVFLNALAYLTQNFKTAKEIVGKTNASNLFANFGSVPTNN